MHLVIKFENLSPEIRTDWTTLKQIISTIQTFYPKEHVQVDVEYSYATVFSVISPTRSIFPKEPILVHVSPIAGPLNTSRLINPQYPAILKSLVSLIVTFLSNSDPANDPSIQPEYVISSIIKISNGMNQFTYVNGEFTPHL